MGPGLRKLSSDFKTKFISEKGTQIRNKDDFGFVELDGFACWAVAESYDNDEDVVSAKLAIDTVLDMFTKKPTLSKRKLKSYITEAHRQLKEQSGKYQLKASIMIVATNYKKMRYAYCGNSRFYLFRGDNIFIRSQDQSYYQEMINQWQIPDDGVQGMAESRNLHNYLGKQTSVKINVSKKIVLYDEDVMLLTTWGFWEKLTNLELIDALEEAPEPQEFVDTLQDLYLSKQEKEVNNYTLATVFANKVYQEKNNKRKIIKIMLIIAIPLLIAGIIALIYFHRANVKRTELIGAIARYEAQGDMYIEDVNYDRALIEYGSALKESAALKETTGKKGEENTLIKDSLTTKQRVAQLIVDADSLFTSGKYAEAKLSLQKALKEAKYDMDLYESMDIEKIESQINLCDDYAYTEDLIALADHQVFLGQNEDALFNYEKARQLAASNKNRLSEQAIQLKVETLRSKMKIEADAQSAAQQAEASQLHDASVKDIDKTVLDGDIAVTNGNYAGAANIYANARTAYLQLGEVDKASLLEQKIASVMDRSKQEENNSRAEIAAGYVRMGDGFMMENQFDIATESYLMARDIYLSINNTQEVTSINEKISNASIRKTEDERNAKLIEIGIIESEGDRLLQQKDYSGAKEQYRQAQVLYQDITQMDKVLSVQEKISGINDLEAEIRNDKALQEKERLVERAADYEKYAHEATLDKKIDLAVTYYNQAKELYQNAGETEKAMRIQVLIDEIEKE